MTKNNNFPKLNEFIVIDKVDQNRRAKNNYQSENALERELIRDLQNQQYEYVPGLKCPDRMLANVRKQLEKLNKITFLDREWFRFVESYLDTPSDGIIDKTRKIHDNHILDFKFDDGHIENIYLFDKKTISRNKVQVIKQFEQTGSHANRYDVTILVNGLPLVQIELKKRGVAIRDAFNQIHRYSKESFNAENSLYKFLQLFVISNGTDTRYFANTTKREKNSFDFTINWAFLKNNHIKDLKEFTSSFLQKNTLLQVLFNYCIFDVNNTLLVMRPYQIAATERILWKIKSAFSSKNWSNIESGGYVWHTTGSGKTLTSFKAAQLATRLDFINKVFFVVDRKDLDYQTMKEYQRFSPDSVNGSNSTTQLRRNLEKKDNKIIVTTIQKLNKLLKRENNLAIYEKHVVFIFDECHRSQFDESQKNLRKKFRYYYQFGFTGTPILKGNAIRGKTTASVFGELISHPYKISHAIHDEKVLKFKVDYNNVSPKFESIETESDERKLSFYEKKKQFLHPERIKKISQYILHNFRRKTHRHQGRDKGFNAMFAVSSVDAAKAYYECFSSLQKENKPKYPLKIATIFSFAANEEQNAIGDILDESFEVNAMNSSAKEFLSAAINDYNAMFKSNYGVDSNGFQNYYRDLAQRVKNQDVDLLIVVGMFLTGFDAPTLNTLFVDKNLRNHGLIQAFSRTNRIYNTTKTFGNIVTFRDLEKATDSAIVLFETENTKQEVLERSYLDYINGFVSIKSRKISRGYSAIVADLQSGFSEPLELIRERDKKEFAQLFGEYLRIERVLHSFDEFDVLKKWKKIAKEDVKGIEAFKARYGVDENDICQMNSIQILTERQIQDYLSNYRDIMDKLRLQEEGDRKNESNIDWSDVRFEVDLIKSTEIGLDYTLDLIIKHNKKNRSKLKLLEEVSKLIHSRFENSAIESLILDFINQTNLNEVYDKESINEAFDKFVLFEKKREIEELIKVENLNVEATTRYISTSLKRGFASDKGIELNLTLPTLSPLTSQYKTKKDVVFKKFVEFVEKYKAIEKA
ncbi:MULTISPECIES: type I restriction endonuclease subunit R [Pseudoalteromonas]|uniref:type I restriction endonuclease subunit R n=1 Tax=Pseudoalteromonas TaxID=53246 RepID=UPI0015840453|nr:MULTISPECIES: type I restriction endonuclease subunit R [Pseudoalteromonas]MDI4652753.1 type I restriction endonuclease subunit R [Pseudoalteromonas shioyasakiensis]NUJ38846.1 type I restriction endonuclease subunit R [Pseudoalteromonas sp. 0303]